MSEHRAAPQTWWCCSADYPNHEPNCPNAAPQEGETPGAPEAREYDRLSDRLRDSGLPELECAEGQSCGSLNALRALLDQVQTLREENTQLRYLDGRLNKAGREQFDRAARAEQSLREKDAEIERLRREKRVSPASPAQEDR